MTRALRLGRLVAAAAVLGGCLVTSKIQVGDWLATCASVPVDDCRGVATLFIGNLGRNGGSVHRDSGGQLTVWARPDCPEVPKWADGSTCWQAAADLPDRRICMVIARQRLPTEPGFGQVGGAQMVRPLGVAAARDWPTCS